MKSPERKNSLLRVLGIDPGSIICGYGVVEGNGAKSAYIASGRIAPPSSGALHERLKSIHEGLTEVISIYQPTDIVIEKIFFAKSPKAALHLGYARGVALLAAASSGAQLHERSALQVKKAVVGYGRAEKSQVQKMVKMILGLKGTLYPDSADALALALCFLNTIQFNVVAQ